MSPEPRIELTTLLLCDYALTSQDGKISAIGMFSQISVQKLPQAHPRLFIVAVMEADPGPYELHLQVVSPQGAPLLREQPRLQLKVPDGATTANIVADLKGLRISELGQHRIEMRHGSRLLGSAPLNVSLVWRQQKAANV